jgi:uncharacterized protein (TIGR02266 family)
LQEILGQEVAMIPTQASPVVDVFRQYVDLYQLRNSRGGALEPDQEREWKEVSFTMESIFSGLYRPDPNELLSGHCSSWAFHRDLPVDLLRVPTETDVLCETHNSFFSGRMQDISTGGAYVHAKVPFEVDSRVKLTFCTFKDEVPLELDGRIAWYNPGGVRKRAFLPGAGIEWVDCERTHRSQIEAYVCELVEETLARANLI